MPSATTLKLVLAVVGLIVFAVGARYENEALRWVAIGLLVVAFLIRFLRRGSDDKRPPEPPHDKPS
ncbi:MAG: hypothetical protein ACT4P7_01155 [Gemmatimonadaceae bacterium]